MRGDEIGNSMFEPGIFELNNLLKPTRDPKYRKFLCGLEGDLMPRYRLMITVYGCRDVRIFF